MRQPPRPLALTLAGVLLLAQAAPGLAQKPEALPPLGAPGDAAERPDPPALVGRLARLEGEVSTRLAGQQDWQPAPANFPLTSGQAVFTGADSRALLQLAETRLALDAGSQLLVGRLAEDGAELTLAEGRAYLTLAARGPELPLRLVTPRGDALLARPGAYLLEAGAEDRPTRLTVLAGSAAFLPPEGEPLTLAAGQALASSGGAPALEPAAPPPPLVGWAEAAGGDLGALPPAVQGMTGAEDLARQGRWTRSPEYGDLWLPPVEPGWVPYRDGRWAYVEPWGWTWVDAAPWGFAPFHYGRWVEWDQGWAWAPGAWPGAGHWPVWAPALVAFLPGMRPGWMGWAPLRPWQPYYPAWRASPAWFQRVNRPYVRDLPGAERLWREHRQAPPPGAWAARGVTLVPQQVLTGSRPVGAAHQPPGLPPAGPGATAPGFGPVAGVLGGAAAGAWAGRAMAAARPGLAPPGGPRWLPPSGPGPGATVMPGGRPPLVPGGFGATRPPALPPSAGKPAALPFAGPPAARPGLPPAAGGWRGEGGKPGGGWAAPRGFGYPAPGAPAAPLPPAHVAPYRSGPPPSAYAPPRSYAPPPSAYAAPRSYAPPPAFAPPRSYAAPAMPHVSPPAVLPRFSPPPTTHYAPRPSSPPPSAPRGGGHWRR